MTPSAATGAPAATPPQDAGPGEDGVRAERDEPASQGGDAAPSTTPSTGARTAAAGGAWAAMRERWPRRRVVVTALLAPVFGALLVDLGGGWGGPPTWTAIVAAVAVTSSAAVSTYVPLPGAGTRPDLGCTPCAAMAGFAVVAAALLVDSAPHDVATALLALAASAFALRQRLTAPLACPTARR